MDYEKLVSCQKGRSCIISVEKYSDGSYGNIRTGIPGVDLF